MAPRTRLIEFILANAPPPGKRFLHGLPRIKQGLMAHACFMGLRYNTQISFFSARIFPLHMPLDRLQDFVVSRILRFTGSQKFLTAQLDITNACKLDSVVKRSRCR